MQNFKSYLLSENQNTNFSITSKVRIEMPHNLNMLSAYRGREKEIKQEFSELAKENGLPEIIKLLFLPSTCSLIHGFFPGKYNKQQIDDIAQKYTDLLGSYLKNETILKNNRLNPQITIYDNYNLDVFIDTIQVDINFKASASLKNINKIVNCESIHFIDIELITGNVLGLLIIPKLKTIYNENFEQDDTLWFNIMDAHIEGDKDILDCQEELITNKLKEYAKL